MRKIPTLYVRDRETGKVDTSQVMPGCEWVVAGEGAPTRKFDGTCAMGSHPTRRPVSWSWSASRHPAGGVFPGLTSRRAHHWPSPSSMVHRGPLRPTPDLPAVNEFAVYAHQYHWMRRYRPRRLNGMVSAGKEARPSLRGYPPR